MYGLIAVFDEATEKRIKEIWCDLKEEGISSYAYEVENRIPHITLASYDNLDPLDIINQMATFYSEKQVIDFTFSTIGSFFNSGALFFQPTLTDELLRLHTEHHHYFREFQQSSNSLYLPSHWIPHCTIANRLSQEKLLEAFDYCSRNNQSINGKIKEIALIKIVDKRNAPIIYSVKLTDK